MRPIVLLVLESLLLLASTASQEQPRELKAGGHVLGETAEQFFSVGPVGLLAHACEAKDWKTVKSLVNTVERLSKVPAKEVCFQLTRVKHEAISGAREEYEAAGDMETLRSDTFTLDHGRLVKMRLIYAIPNAEIEGLKPKPFEELFAGLREAYGEPSKTYAETVVDTFGVRRDAHRAIWFGEQDVIRVTERPGDHGQTEIIAETLAEYKLEEQMPKNANPLQ